MNYSFLALLAIVAGISAEQVALHPREYYEQMFFDHMQQFKLDFADGKEFAKRLQIFANMVDTIEKHNADSTQTFTMGLNQFSHMTFDEFVQAVHLDLAPPALRGFADEVHPEPADASANPTSVDWAAKGKVGSVKNQGNCGSCWSFSAVGAVESALSIKGGAAPLDLAEQHLVSCDKTDSGCNGGWMDSAFTWIKNNGGIADEATYPYKSGTSGSSGTCQSGTKNHAGTAVTGYVDVTTNSVSALESAVVGQPVSIAIQANQPAFQSYKSGVITSGCGQRLDHGVLLTGYGHDSAQNVDYWKVKNSWGATWGEQGYVRILKSSANMCGVLSAPSYPKV